MTIELLHRNRFVAVPGAAARKVAANVWTLQIPVTDAIRRLVPRADDPEAWDGAVFSLDGKETDPAVGSGGRPG
ncbi:MAG: hypothetical protein ABMB14_41285, partial [Myxococcota bacterium]